MKDVNIKYKSQASLFYILHFDIPQPVDLLSEYF